MKLMEARIKPLDSVKGKTKLIESRRHDLLSDAAAHAAAVAKMLGVSDTIADHVGAAVADRLAENWGGQNIGFPKDAAFELSERERDILTAYRNRVPVFKLAIDYKMTERGIRKLLDRAALRYGVSHEAQRQDDNLNQIDLFKPCP